MQADLRTDKLPPECVSSNQNFMFLSDIHSFVRLLSRFHSPMQGFVRLHCLRLIFSFLSMEKLCGSCGCFLELLRSSSERDLRSTCSTDHCLSMPWLPALRKTMSASRIADKQMLHSCMNQSHSPFCFPSLHLAILSPQQHVSFKPSSRPGSGWTSEGFKQDPLPSQRAHGSVFVCVPGICWSLTLRRRRRQRYNTLPGDHRGASW